MSRLCQYSVVYIVRTIQTNIDTCLYDLLRNVSSVRMDILYIETTQACLKPREEEQIKRTNVDF